MTHPQKHDDITIRYGIPDDNHLLADLGARTFYETFAADNSPENMAAFLADTYGPEKQARELANPAMIFLLAEVASNAVGYAVLRADDTEAGITGSKPVELRRIYTLQAWLGRGVGAALIQASIREAQQRGHDSLWLGVWEHNARARAFYRKWGFVDVGTHVFVVGDDPQNDIVMELRLNGTARG